MIRTVPNIMMLYQCSSETAQRYIDLRDEGYHREQALLMAGLTDPPEPADTADRAQDGYCHNCEDVRHCGTIRKCLHGKPGTPGVTACPKGKGACAKVLPDKRCFDCPAGVGGSHGR